VFETAKVYCNLIQYEFPLEADVILGAFDWPEIPKKQNAYRRMSIASL